MHLGSSKFSLFAWWYLFCGGGRYIPSTLCDSHSLKMSLLLFKKLQHSQNWHVPNCQASQEGLEINNVTCQSYTWRGPRSITTTNGSLVLTDTFAYVSAQLDRNSTGPDLRQQRLDGEWELDGANRNSSLCVRKGLWFNGLHFFAYIYIWCLYFIYIIYNRHNIYVDTLLSLLLVGNCCLWRLISFWRHQRLGSFGEDFDICQPHTEGLL